MYARYGKRTLDLALALIGAILIFIPMLIVAMVIKLNSKGPVFFTQYRYGKDKQPFMVYKFRTMSVDAPSELATNSFMNSVEYITRSGKFMRKLSIDELPQIINVLRGEMSIVGPRPVVLSETSLIVLRDQFGANSVKPGITGWAQVNGRDELNDIIKSRMDGYYIDNFGFVTDAKCILWTFLVILTAKGHSESHERIEWTDLVDGKN